MLELAHPFGEHPQRPIQIHAAIDAADRARLDAPTLRRAPVLSPSHHVLLNALERGPETVPEVLGATSFDQLLAAIAGSRVTTLESREPTLEEVFLSYYAK